MVPRMKVKMKTTFQGWKKVVLSCIFTRRCLHLPFYFGEQCIFMRSCLHLPFYFREHCIFMRKKNCPWNIVPPAFFEISLFLFVCYLTTTYCKLRSSLLHKIKPITLKIINLFRSFNAKAHLAQKNLSFMFF